MYRTIRTELYAHAYVQTMYNVVVQNLDVILTEVSEGMPCTEGPEETAPLGSYTCRSTSMGLFTYFKTRLSGRIAPIFYFNFRLLINLLAFFFDKTIYCNFLKI